MGVTVEDYADSIMALMPGGKAVPDEETSILRAIALAMADGFVRLHNASTELLADVDPGGFSLEAAEAWFNLVGDEARTGGLITAERYRESVLFKLTMGGTFTEDMVTQRLAQRDISTGVLFIPALQKIRVGYPVTRQWLLDDILPAHISLIYDSSMLQ